MIKEPRFNKFKLGQGFSDIRDHKAFHGATLLTEQKNLLQR
jgi:hypothetical protein